MLQIDSYVSLLILKGSAVTHKIINMIAFVCLFLAYARTICAQTTNSDADLKQNREQANFIISGYKHSQQQLVSGMYSISGKIKDTQPGISSIEGDFKYFSAFDHQTSRLRFDREEPVQPTSENRGKTPFGVFTSKCQFIRTPDKQILVTSRGSGPPVSQKGSPEVRFPRNATPINPYALPITTYADLQNAVEFEDSIKNLITDPPPHVIEQSQNITKLSWKFPGRNRTVWFDKSKGFCPIKMTISDPDLPDLYQDIEVDWKQINNTWVPVSYHLSEHFSKPRIIEHSFSIEWHSVNETIPESYFTEKGLKYSGGTIVFDKRLRNSNAPGKVVDRNATSNFAQNDTASHRRTLYVLLTISIIASIIIILLSRRINWAKAS